MAEITLQNGRFIFKEGERERVLLDCADFLANKSRIPMHKLPGQDFVTIPDLLLSLLDRTQKRDGELAFPAALMDVALAGLLTRSSRPVKFLEYGCRGGRLSWHFAELLGAFHPESVFIGASGTAEPEWLRKVADVPSRPAFGFLCGDYGKIHRQQGGFDIVLINGLEKYGDPAAVLSDAARMVREDGTIFCYVNGAPLLESTFKLFFEKREEYAIAPVHKLLAAKAADRSWHI